MKIYYFIRRLLFRLAPETAHVVTLKLIKCISILGIAKLFPKITKPCHVMGLTFQNGVGLAAGFDKNGEYIDALADLGFGFIEVGTVTPKPQVGNSKPRIFRLQASEAVINRLGFNNKGVDYLVEQVKKMRYRGILGINIGKNKDTLNEQAVSDYLYCFKRVVPYASYITINISSPNTPELRSLQHGNLLQNLLHTLKEEQQAYFQANKKYVPLVVKIAPDLTKEALEQMASVFLSEKIDGVIATNTTLKREAVANFPYADEAGGLSGKPLFSLSTAIVRQLSVLLGDKIPIIGCGGIMSNENAREKRTAGASLVQVYTGLIYRGPGLIHEIAQAIG